MQLHFCSPRSTPPSPPPPYQMHHCKVHIRDTWHNQKLHLATVTVAIIPKKTQSDGWHPLCSSTSWKTPNPARPIESPKPSSTNGKAQNPIRPMWMPSSTQLKNPKPYMANGKAQNPARPMGKLKNPARPMGKLKTQLDQWESFII